jgi:hypothetical protein
MSNLFRNPKVKQTAASEPVEEQSVIQEDSEEAKRRERSKAQTGGQRSTVLSGNQIALKKRLGE